MGHGATRNRLAAAAAAGVFLSAFVLVTAGDSIAAQEAPGFGLPADDARRLVVDILDDPRFTSRQSENILNRIGRALSGYVQRAINWFNRTVLGVGEDSTGGRFLFWTIITLIILIGAAFVASRLAKRRSASLAIERSTGRKEQEAESPEALELRAAAALERRQHEEAIRLYYRAGLIRLGRRGAIEYEPSLTSGEVADMIRLAVFDHIAQTFDGVAYGRRTSDADQVTAARADWEKLLAGGS
jgi:hypothetical protein